ncbi:MAG TPA: CARDB domain-containing protein, partial [Pirellulales bacterium]|nr:CARDB domain-containing protein [Pirellulales bacterium]
MPTKITDTPSKSASAETPITPRVARAESAVSSRATQKPSAPIEELLGMEPAVMKETPVATPVSREVVRESSIPAESKLRGRKSPSLSVETVGPRRIVVGKEAQYTISLRNTGDMAASDVIVSISAPEWAEVVEARATSGTAANGSGEGGFQWKLNSVAALSNQELTLKLIPRKSQPFDLAVRWTCAAPMSQTTVEVDEPKLQMAITGPTEMVFGQQQIYKLTISNPGTGDADDVVIHLLPLTAGENTTASHRVGKLRAGSSTSVEIELTARQAGQLTIKAEATGDGDLKASSATEVWVRRAALEVVAVAPKMHYAGPPITCEVRVRNTGDTPARQVAVTTLLPTGAEFVSASEGGKVEGASGDVIWAIPQLAPGAEATVICKYTVKSSGSSRVETMVTADGDLKVAAAASTQVLAIADVVLDILDAPGPVPVGEDAIYT